MKFMTIVSMKKGDQVDELKIPGRISTAIEHLKKCYPFPGKFFYDLSRFKKAKYRNVIFTVTDEPIRDLIAK